VVLAVPLLVVLRPGFSAAGIEQTAPQVLIYGWMLQFGYVVLPYLLKSSYAASGSRAEWIVVQPGGCPLW